DRHADRAPFGTVLSVGPLLPCEKHRKHAEFYQPRPSRARVRWIGGRPGASDRPRAGEGSYRAGRPSMKLATAAATRRATARRSARRRLGEGPQRALIRLELEVGALMVRAVPRHRVDQPLATRVRAVVAHGESLGLQRASEPPAEPGVVRIQNAGIEAAP